jgi:endonuclease-8
LIVAIDETPREVAHLGPDVLSESFDANEAVRRLRERADLPIGVAIMDQKAVAGVGNIYKSETLFSVRANPFAPVSALTDEQLRAIVDRARRLMRSNLHSTTMRTTTQRSDQRYYVYKRSHRPCVRCGTIVEMQRQGEQARSTYYCPKCQHVA